MSSDDRVFRALAEPNRRRILELLAGGERSVNEIAAELPVTKQAVSQHLRALLDAGLVSVRADGASRIYAVDPSGLAELPRFVDRVWPHALRRLKASAEGMAGAAGRPDVPAGETAR